ncbi:hypothetical protein [Paenibacillus sp.]|jgi:DNA-binding transcriptional MerR regulator|uniref:hypothetical protein n=1 Tax=Paenibacillus sp. TaxID=58172 RepID=UPI002821DB2D|nr:hypothetical protein [Paenibacillus sp.]MDR0269130.1 hypothetical protein [Paenibacillus sp.]
MKILKKRNSKKLIAASLCVGLVASMFSTVTTSFAQEVVEQFNEKILGLPSSNDMIQVPNAEPNITATQNNDLSKFSEATGVEEVVHKSIKTESKVNPSLARSLQINTKKKDVFNLTKEQIERLISEGYSIEDVYKLDELSNELLIDPETLSKKKKELQLDWDSLKTTIQKAQLDEHLLQFKEKFPNEYGVLMIEKFNNNDNFMLLSMFEQGKGTIDELIGRFKAKGLQGVMSMNQNTDKKMLSKSTKASSFSIDPIVLESLKEISKQSGQPLNELVDNFVKAKSSVDEILVKKE